MPITYSQATMSKEYENVLNTMLPSLKVESTVAAGSVSHSDKNAFFILWDRDISTNVYSVSPDEADSNKNGTSLKLHSKDGGPDGYEIRNGNRNYTHLGIRCYAWTVKEKTGIIWFLVHIAKSGSLESDLKVWTQFHQGMHVIAAPGTYTKDGSGDYTYYPRSDMAKYQLSLLNKFYPSKPSSTFPTAIFTKNIFQADKGNVYLYKNKEKSNDKISSFYLNGEACCTSHYTLTSDYSTNTVTAHRWHIAENISGKKIRLHGGTTRSPSWSDKKINTELNTFSAAIGVKFTHDEKDYLWDSGLRSDSDYGIKNNNVMEWDGTTRNNTYSPSDMNIYEWTDSGKCESEDSKAWKEYYNDFSFKKTDKFTNFKSIHVDYKYDGKSNDNIYLKYERKNTLNNGVTIYDWHLASDGFLMIKVGFDLPELSGNSTKSYDGWIRCTDGVLILINKDGNTNGANMSGDGSEVDQTGATTEEQEHQVEERQGSTEWENSAEYQTTLDAGNARDGMKFWSQLYNGEENTYSLKSHRSIIGLPLQFMPNVDMRVGSSTYGKQYMEDIIYDAAVVCIKPGGPVLNPKWSSGDTDDGSSSAPAYSDDGVTKLLTSFGRWKAYWEMFKNLDSADGWRQLLYSVFTSGSARFYSFMQDYTHYTHYVNTLCHMFIAWLDIVNDEYYISNGIKKKYMNFNEYYQEIETDAGLGINYQYGYDTAVYAYYSPESDINQTFTNSTTESQLSATIREASDVSKEWGFLMNAAGLEKGAGLFDWSSIATSISSFTSRIPVVGRLFGNLSEGVTTILAGNNISLPEIYADSDTTTQHTFKIKLVSPYGDRESIFWYVLRPLAKLLAFSLPRQYGPNSYTSPFIVQAFSKGQFNCQLGIVTELSVTRGGNGGESHTIHHLPTELEVSLTIADMYEKVYLSNEYFGNSHAGNVIGAGIDWLLMDGESAYGTMSKLMQTGTTMQATHLMFNNVGLIDFTASLAGGNLNQPSFMSSWTFISQLMKNRAAETVVYENGEWRFPFWEKTLRDSFNQTTTNIYSAISTGG